MKPPKTRKTERWYTRQLLKVARHVGAIVASFPDAGELGDWSTATAAKMLADVNRADEQAWRDRAVDMSRALRQELRQTRTGDAMRALLAEQVTLIKSIPLDAAQRVHDLTLAGLESSGRAREVAKEIKRQNEVSASKATLIARTEVARSASKLTEARAQQIGSEGYTWRTSEDGDVRDSHREMNGKFVPWSKPPTLSDGTTTHAGQIYNCRCYPDPVIPL
jgi:SPP1 gp7 family putative phage head morphogenesis protein